MKQRQQRRKDETKRQVRLQIFVWRAAVDQPQRFVPASSGVLASQGRANLSSLDTHTLCKFSAACVASHLQFKQKELMAKHRGGFRSGRG